MSLSGDIKKKRSVVDFIKPLTGTLLYCSRKMCVGSSVFHKESRFEHCVCVLSMELTILQPKLAKSMLVHVCSP